jgi:hypothetical protein
MRTSIIARRTLTTLSAAALLAAPARAALAQRPVPAPVAARTHARPLDVRATAGDSTWHRSPLAAALMSAAVPGLGHAYAGEPGRGVLLCAIWGGSLAYAFGHDTQLGGLSAVVALGTVVYAVIDAPAAVHRGEHRHAARRARGVAQRPE